MKEKELEQLFNDGLGNLEADVNPNAWSNIAEGLKAPAEPAPAITSAVKGGGLFSYSGLLLTVAAAGIITAVYFGTKKSDNGAGQPLASTQVVKEQPSNPAVTTTAEQPASSSEIQTSNNSANQKPSVSSTAKQKAASTPAAVKNNSVMDTKSEVHTTVTPSNVSPTSTETKPSVNNNHVTLSAPAVTDNSAAKPGTPSEPKQIAPSVDKKASDPATAVDVKKDLVMHFPTAFTPDGDVNKTFFPVGDDVAEFIMSVWDFKGELVFNSKEASEAWDGKLKNGELAPAGIYSYASQITDHSGVIHPKNGKVKLIR